VVKGGDDPLRMDERLDKIIPDNANKPYNIKDVIRMVVDNGDLYEIHEHFAPNIVVGFCAAGRAERGDRGEPTGRAGRSAGY